MLPLVLAVAGAVVKVAVDASPSCVDQEAFTRALARHSDAIAVGDGDSGTIELRMREGDEVEGVVRVTALGRAPWQRVIRGRSCDEVTDALALVVAMSFDEEPPPPPRMLPPPPVTSPNDVPDRVVAPAPAAPSRWHGAIGAGMGPLLLGEAALSLSYGGFGELELDRNGLVSPSFRLGITHAESSVDVGGRGAALVWTTGKADVCPLRREFTEGFGFRSCVALDLGVLSATPRGLGNPHEENRPWASTSITGRFRLVPERLFFVEGELGVTIPIVRDELAADPSLTLYRAPPVAPLAAVYAGIRIP